MLDRIVAVALTIERQDLIRGLVKSYRDTWSAHAADEAEGGMPPLVVLNMGDDDGTEGWLRNQAEQGLPIAVLRHPGRLSYAQAMNLAVKVALEQYPEAGWLLLLNDDLELQSGFWDGLSEMAGYGYEIIGSKLLYPPDHEHAGQIQHVGKWVTLDFYPFHVLRYMLSDHPQSMVPHAVPLVTFACAAVRRDVWEGLNGLDEGYTNGYDDDDFILRAKEQGVQVGVHPRMLAIHRESATTGKDTENKQRQWERFHSIWIATGRIQWPLGVFSGWRNA